MASLGGSSVIFNCGIGGDVEAGSSTIISDSRVLGTLDALDSSVITNNILGCRVSVGNSSQILDNTIYADVYAPDSVIANNTIEGGVTGGELSNNKITGAYVTGEVIAYNTIIGCVTVGDSAVVENNLIQGGRTEVYTDIPGVTGFRYAVTIYFGAVHIDGDSSLVSNNIIDGGITVNKEGSSPTILNNTITNYGIYIPYVLEYPSYENPSFIVQKAGSPNNVFYKSWLVGFEILCSPIFLTANANAVAAKNSGRLIHDGNSGIESMFCSTMIVNSLTGAAAK